ncbi:hypothetical protein QJS10_CPB12g00685 [Acorus calamus]|uniref:Glycosyltransferase 61 catalytic domain-containing protein n=1 Tax=Acorus calamus TaxID=4465 RepID=A0AAV9DNG9_ACOCL|nr:hypothetical protein QJS10_CPB12g00685 [Acorus calamus]
MHTKSTKKERLKGFFFDLQVQRMRKNWSRFALGIMFLPLIYVVLLQSDAYNLNSWKLQIAQWIGSSDASNMLLLQKLATGTNKRELYQNGATCISYPDSDVCVATGEVRLDTKTSTFHLTAGQRLHYSPTSVKPYTRKKDNITMSWISEVKLQESGATAPPCQFNHTSPAIVFATSGFAGNFYHDMNDILLPLFMTAGHFRSQVHLVVVNIRDPWVLKYRKILSHISRHPLIVSPPRHWRGGEREVHCFPGAVVGLKYYDNLVCNASDVPDGHSIVDFKKFIHESFSLNFSRTAPTTQRPSLVLISRSRTRVLLNEEEIVGLAEEVGFRVTVANRTTTSDVERFAEMVNACEVLVGAHGAGLMNFLFLAREAVLVQVVPWGLDWASETYYGGPSQRIGVKYVEYKTEVDESSLYGEYPMDDPVIADPLAIHKMGYKVSRKIYIDGQNVTLNLSRFRETLVKVFRMVRPEIL